VPSLPTIKDRDLGRRWSESGLLVAADAAAVFAGCLAVAPLRYAILCTVFTVGVVSAAGLFRSRLSFSVLDDLPRLLAACGIALTIVFATLPVWDGGGVGRFTDSRVAATLVLATVALVAVRTASYAVIRAARRSRRGRPLLMVGVGDAAALLTRTLLECPEFGLEPVGCVAVAPVVGEPPLPLLGKVDDLAELVAETKPRYLAIALGATESRDADMVRILRACGQLPCRVFLLPHLYELHPNSSAVEVVRGIPLVRVGLGRPGPVGGLAKRAFDVALAGMALLLVSPLMLVCALGVFREGGPGVLFRQTRIGRDGIPFTLLKFRSLKPATQNEADTHWTIADDARIGPVGRLLRKTSLDELPQLINILRGEMSLIGPRPERPHFVEEFSARYHRYVHRHRMNAGLTGLAQVHGLRGDTSIDDRALLDNYYIENWSFWLDVKIALRTAAVLFKGAQ
jgi:exopolysaccharide biosynthesis polyprenyl glycosylphosphotransferase